MADARARIVDGPLGLELARFGAPLALGMALQVVFNLVDTWILAHLPAAEVDAAMGALGICDQLAAVGTILCYGVSTATATRLAVMRGAGDAAGARRTAWQSLLVIGALSVVFGVLGVAFADAIVRQVVGAKGAVADVASSYLRVILGGGFSVFFLFQLASVQRALGSSKTPVVLLALGNAVNVALAILLVFGPDAPPVFAPFAALARAVHAPRMGMVGAAWATIAARVLVLAPLALVGAARFPLLPRTAAEARPDARELRAIVSLAWPASAQLVLRVCAMVLVTSVVARAYTTATDQTASTALGLVFRLDTMALFVAMGWGSAAQTFVGHCLGAGRPARARRAGLVAALYDAMTSAALAWALLRWGRDVLRVLDADPAPLAVAAKYLGAVAPSWVGLGPAMVLANAVAGAGATRTAFVVDACVVGGALAPACVGAAALGLPLDAVFQAVGAANVVALLAFAAAYFRSPWTAAVARIRDPA